MNTELTKTLWDIESHINAILTSPHESAGDTRLQEALEDAQDLQTKWDVHRALHMDFCLRKAAERGAIASELYKELIERLWTAMRAEQPDPEEPVVRPKCGVRPHKAVKVAIFVTAAIAIVLMVITAMAMIFDIPFGELIRTVVIVTAVAAVLLGVIWVVCGGDTGPELK